MSQPVVDLVRAERHRQIESLGRKPEKDRGRELELLGYAREYLNGAAYTIEHTDELANPARTLVKSAALIVAVIEALQNEDK